MIQFEEYSEEYLEKSWNWLNDIEIKKLTNTPDFTKEQQVKWFENLVQNDTYKIWGVSYNGIPIGVFGIKNIDCDKKNGEYWGYIGEKKYWGKGIGTIVLTEILKKASEELGLNSIYLKVLIHNSVAIKLYEKLQFVKKTEVEDILIMEKKLDSNDRID